MDIRQTHAETVEHDPRVDLRLLSAPGHTWFRGEGLLCCSAAAVAPGGAGASMSQHTRGSAHDLRAALVSALLASLVLQKQRMHIRGSRRIESPRDARAATCTAHEGPGSPHTSVEANAGRSRHRRRSLSSPLQWRHVHSCSIIRCSAPPLSAHICHCSAIHCSGRLQHLVFVAVVRERLAHRRRHSCGALQVLAAAAAALACQRMQLLAAAAVGVRSPLQLAFVPSATLLSVVGQRARTFDSTGASCAAVVTAASRIVGACSFVVTAVAARRSSG